MKADRRSRNEAGRGDPGWQPVRLEPSAGEASSTADAQGSSGMPPRRRDPDPAGHLSAARRQPVHLPHRRAVAGRRAPPPRARPFQHAERRSRQRHSVILDDLGVRPAGDRPYRALDVHLIPRRPAHFHQALRRQCEELDGEQHRLAAGQPQDARRAPASGPRRPVPAHRPACGRSSVWATLEGGCLALHRATRRAGSTADALALLAAGHMCAGYGLMARQRQQEPHQ